MAGGATKATPPPKMMVIGCGHGRTGTTSLREALVHLLGGKCYHMDCITIEGCIDHTETWMAMAEAKGRGDTAEVVALGKQVLSGYTAAIDWPPSLFYKELMQAYPEAKLVYTAREADKWYGSVFETLWGVRLAQEGTWMIKVVPFVKQFNKFIDAVIWKGPNSLFKGTFTDKAAACAMYDAWLEEVKATVPADRLVLFDVKQGYEPLCKGLGLPVPKEKFPNVNEKKRFEDLIKIMGRADKMGKFVIFPAITIGLAAGIAFGIKKLLA